MVVCGAHMFIISRIVERQRCCDSYLLVSGCTQAVQKHYSLSRRPDKLLNKEKDFTLLKQATLRQGCVWNHQVFCPRKEVNDGGLEKYIPNAWIYESWPRAFVLLSKFSECASSPHDITCISLRTKMSTSLAPSKHLAPRGARDSGEKHRCNPVTGHFQKLASIFVQEGLQRFTRLPRIAGQRLLASTNRRVSIRCQPTNPKNPAGSTKFRRLLLGQMSIISQHSDLSLFSFQTAFAKRLPQNLLGHVRTRRCYRGFVQGSPRISWDCFVKSALEQTSWTLAVKACITHIVAMQVHLATLSDILYIPSAVFLTTVNYTFVAGFKLEVTRTFSVCKRYLELSRLY